MKDSRINGRYAKALFDIAIEQQITDVAFQDMQLVKNICIASKEFESLMSSPIIKTDKKQAVVKEIMGNQLNKVSLSFLLLILKKRREANLRNIALEYIEMYNEYKGIKTAYLKTAIELDQPTKTEFINLLSSQSNKKVELLEDINPSIIGGFIVTIDDKQADNSISTKIQRLRKEFDKNIYEKGF
ncbi:MAG: ATP synthase F1 subunit delta [Bacteroidetes bacterium]|nr:ATP synthase F1 subunit delta [Bacteroidota bacterium]